MFESNKVVPVRPVSRIKKINSKKSKHNQNEKKKSKHKKNQKDFIDISINHHHNKKNQQSTYSNPKNNPNNNLNSIEKISNELLTFLKLMYEIYKENHHIDDKSLILNKFYTLAKKGINAGYEEISNNLPYNQKSLIKTTSNQSLARLTAWFNEHNIEITEVNISDAISKKTRNQIKKMTSKIFIEEIKNINNKSN
ncbi:hypothetical protein [Orenia marismortui]|uniref:hypothetical protein n=1 Tax=Orenia marismortui TaxID=46469 RepID=UPI00036A3218|nr:hypothetical protein [Orenia marismortui]